MFDMLSKYVFHPLWDIKDRSIRLITLRKLMESQWLPEASLRERQWERLREIVKYAYSNSDHYRDIFNQLNLSPNITSLEQFRKIPFLTKKDIQENTDRLISKRFRKRKLVPAKTGGSTGKALQIYADRRWQEIRTADALRADRWANWDLGKKTAAIWGNPPMAHTWREKLRSNLIERAIYLDTMLLSTETMDSFVTRYREYQPELIFGHAHSIYIFAKYLRENGISDFRPKGIVSTSMMLIASERAVIEDVLQCKVTNRYGCEEVGLIACECEQHNGLHLNIEHLFIEFLNDDGTPVQPGEEGQIVITDLFNLGMPFIRYRIEDVGVPSVQKCVCGRGLPLMDSITGRRADFLVRSDGSLVAGVSLVERTLTAIEGIEQMQIVQPSVDRLTINLVTRKGYDAAGEAALRIELGRVFGDDIIITLSYGPEIPQERNGKYRFSICKL